MCACNIKPKKNGNWLGPIMDLFGRLLDLSLENNAFLVALMDLFQKNSSRLIKLIVTARPNLSWHYGKWGDLVLEALIIILGRGGDAFSPQKNGRFKPMLF
jgi:hypothetical protein